MCRACSTPTTGPDVAGRARRTLRVLCLPVLVLLATLPFGAALRPAGADTVTDLQAQAAAVAHRLVREQLRVDAARQQTSVITAKVAADGQAIAQISQQLAVDQRTIAHHLRLVQTQAIQSYIDAGAHSSGSDSALFSVGTARSQAASEYASLAVGNITAEMDQLHTAQHALQAQQSAFQAQQGQDRADQARQTADLNQAAGAAAALQAQQARLTGQLAGAVAAQQTIQARQAAAAVAHAPRASSPQSDSPGTVPSGGADGAPPTTVPSGQGGGDPYPTLPDPALNPFLTCVVQAESGGNYGITSPDGLYMGAFQFSQPTWNTAASAAGLGLLVGVPPNRASKAEQDTVAVALYALDGQQPWLGDRCAQG